MLITTKRLEIIGGESPRRVLGLVLDWTAAYRRVAGEFGCLPEKTASPKNAFSNHKDFQVLLIVLLLEFLLDPCWDSWKNIARNL